MRDWEVVGTRRTFLHRCCRVTHAATERTPTVFILSGPFSQDDVAMLLVAIVLVVVVVVSVSWILVRLAESVVMCFLQGGYARACVCARVSLEDLCSWHIRQWWLRDCRPHVHRCRLSSRYVCARLLDSMAKTVRVYANVISLCMFVCVCVCVFTGRVS